MARILVADDERDLVWALQRVLRDDGHEADGAYDGIEALAAAQRNRPDLIVLDVVMPRLDGVQVCQALRRDPCLAAVPILFLSLRATVPDRVTGLDEGADDYLAKPFDFKELRARVRALLRRSAAPAANSSPPEDTSVVSLGCLSLDLRSGRISVDGESRQLTPTERDLVLYFLKHPGEALSSAVLLRQVWGYPPGASELGLVRWHIRNIRAKIEPDPLHPTYIQTLPRHGFLLEVPSAVRAPTALRASPTRFAPVCSEVIA